MRAGQAVRAGSGAAAGVAGLPLRLAVRHDLPGERQAGTPADDRAAAGDRRRQAAYQQGLSGADLDPSYPPDLQDAWEAGRSEAATRARAPQEQILTDEGPGPAPAPSRSGGPGARPTSTATVSQQGAGLFVGLIAYALLVNYIRGGTPQVKGWLAAKFMNKPYTGGASTASTTAAVL